MSEAGTVYYGYPYRLDARGRTAEISADVFC